MTAVSFRGVTFAYPQRDPVLRDLDLDVPAGDVLLVMGPSGSGKSTLLRCVNGLVPHSTGGRFGGEVVSCGRSTRDHPPREMADVVGFVHQDPEAHFVVDRVEGDIAFVLENLGLPATAMRRRVEEVLDALDVAHLRHRSPSTLSGGERQRAAVAAALAAAPPVLVLDEPTSQLDPQGAEDVLASLGRLNDDLGTTIVLSEHRLERVAAMAHAAVVMGNGVRRQPLGDAVAAYAGAPSVTRLGRLLGWDPLPLTVRDARVQATAHPPDLASPDVPAPVPGRPLVEAKRLRVALGGRPVLNDVDIEVSEGIVLALLGRNGSGKTTLLRALAGLQDAASGEVVRRTSVAYVPQDPNSLLFAPSVSDELRHTMRLLGTADHGVVDEWLDRLGLHEVAARHPRSLSSGERQRVAIAAVAVGGPAVLLLDEPTRGMDAPSKRALEHAMREHAAAGGAVVIATHDVELAALSASHALVLADGDVVASGVAREVLAGSLFAPQVLRVLPPFLTVEEVAAALGRTL